jgi:protein-L-isoaspartate(D-aspartate) O-methyltransferase
MQGTDTYRHKGLRKELVVKLRDKGIADDRVLEAVGRIPRHLFFGKDSIFFETHAYEDKAFPIGEDQTISQPYTVARQTELLEVKPNDKILEIGTGSGYQATVLMLMKAKVYSIERHKILFDRTSRFLPFMKEFLLSQSGERTEASERRTWKNEPELWSVKCIYGDGFEGSPANAPYDSVLITAAVPELPRKLLKQLVVGGKMVLPFGSEENCTMLRITKHEDEKFETEEFGSFAFVPMLKGKK